VTERESAFVFRIFVSARQAELCATALVRLRALCEAHLYDRYDLTVIDVDDHAEVAEDEGIVVVPTVLRDAPFPQQRVIGDLSDDVRTMAALGFPDPHGYAFEEGRP
jgi:circadian clock protein KaiB